MVLGATSMLAMSSMKQMQERAKQQQNVGQGAKEMRLMFFPKEEQRYGGKPEERERAA
jgi:hypothetical protein